jgi:hypothetical protein
MEQERNEITAGQRLRCEQCGSEAIVVRAEDAPPMSCCGADLTIIFSRQQS